MYKSSRTQAVCVTRFGIWFWDLIWLVFTARLLEIEENSISFALVSFMVYLQTFCLRWDLSKVARLIWWTWCLHSNFDTFSFISNSLLRSLSSVLILHEFNSILLLLKFRGLLGSIPNSFLSTSRWTLNGLSLVLDIIYVKNLVLYYLFSFTCITKMK